MRKQLEVRDADASEYTLIEEVTQATYKEYAEVLPKPFWEIYWRHMLATLKEKGPVERLVANELPIPEYEADSS